MKEDDTTEGSGDSSTPTNQGTSSKSGIESIPSTASCTVEDVLQLLRHLYVIMAAHEFSSNEFEGMVLIFLVFIFIINFF